MPRARAHEQAREKLALVGLKGLDARLPSELSGGQQQRVAVARALVLEPEVLCFDEPLSNLDAKLRRRVREDIRELQQRLGLTVAYVTHDQQEALAVSDRIIVMDHAAIAQSGTPRELYEAPVSLFVADFVGDSNLVDAELTSRNGVAGQVRVGGVELRLPHRGAGLGPVKVAVRPESLRLSACAAAGTGPRGPDRQGRLPGHPHGIHCLHGGRGALRGGSRGDPPRSRGDAGVGELRGSRRHRRALIGIGR